MRDQAVWSVSLGRWCGVHVRVHMFFLLFAAFTLYLSSLARGANPNLATEWLGVLSLVTLFGSVILHEFAHVFAVQSLGGQCPVMVLGPVGGLLSPRMPRSPWSELTVVIAGPAANSALCLLASILLAVRRGNLDAVHLMNPWNILPLDTVDRTQLTLQIVFLVNYFLTVINLIPAYPFDGGRALRALLVAFVPSLRAEHTVRLVAVIAKMVCVGFFTAAVMLWMWPTAPVAGVPVWFGLLLLSIFIFFSARREEIAFSVANWMHDPVGGDPELGSDQESVLVGVRRRIDAWRQKRKELQREQQLIRDHLEDARVDEILIRLHEHGAAGLTPEEQQILRRAGERYRNRGSLEP